MVLDKVVADDARTPESRNDVGGKPSGDMLEGKRQVKDPGDGECGVIGQLER